MFEESAEQQRLDNSLLTAHEGIVICPACGGETLVEGSDLTVRDERPVVVVGSMRNPSTVGYEGAANLLDAFRVAADPAARSCAALINSSALPFRALTRCPTSRFDGPGAAFSHVSLICARMPFLRDIQRLRKSS